ncbi:MAG: acyltransferase [Prevotellaceae bacterium]|nr:acyltransferase [Prevotellaceae bacterium]
MNALARVLGLSVKVHNEMGDVWEHRLYKKPWFCKLYIWCSYLDNKIARRKVMRLKSDYVICDRWINDILIDLGAECRFDDILDSKWYCNFHTILPKNSCQFVVIRNRQAVLDCRLENHVNPDFPYRFELYQKLAKKEDVNVVDNSGTIEESVKQVMGGGDRMKSNNRVAWISILQAITMAAVLIGHIDLAGNMNPDYPIASWLDTLQAFQIPVFFFISGFLFVRSSSFAKGLISGGVIQSKVIRLGIPFLFLSFSMWGLKLCLPASTLEHPISVSWEYFLKIFLMPFKGPCPHIWFLETLFILFLLMPTYKWTLNNKMATTAWIVLLFFLTFAPYKYIGISGEYENVLCLNQICRFWVYFYLGMVVQKYGLIRYFQNRWVLTISAALYYAAVIKGWGALVSSVFGIAFIVSLSHWLSDIRPNLFSSYSRYTYQIYLLHMLPIMAMKFVYHRNIMEDSTWFPICWIVALLCAIYIPTMVAKVAERCPKPLRMLIGL